VVQVGFKLGREVGGLAASGLRVHALQQILEESVDAVGGGKNLGVTLGNGH